MNPPGRKLFPPPYAALIESIHRALLNVFLVDICELKYVDLSSLDFKSVPVLCFFINIYHTLLLHARLVLGRPNKQVRDLYLCTALSCSWDTVCVDMGFFLL